MRRLVCDGAERAMTIRGLPEMPITRLMLENANLRANRGISCMFADDVDLRDVRLDVAGGMPFVADQVNGLAMSRFNAVTLT